MVSWKTTFNYYFPVGNVGSEISQTFLSPPGKPIAWTSLREEIEYCGMKDGLTLYWSCVHTHCNSAITPVILLTVWLLRLKYVALLFCLRVNHTCNTSEREYRSESKCISFFKFSLLLLMEMTEKFIHLLMTFLCFCSLFVLPSIHTKKKREIGKTKYFLKACHWDCVHRKHIENTHTHTHTHIRTRGMQYNNQIKLNNYYLFLLSVTFARCECPPKGPCVWKPIWHGNWLENAECNGRAISLPEEFTSADTSVICRCWSSLLPPASEGWRKVIFSVCSHLRGGGGGGYPLPANWWWVPPSFLTGGKPILPDRGLPQSGWWGGGLSHLANAGPDLGWGTPHPDLGWGYPPTPHPDLGPGQGGTPTRIA